MEETNKRFEERTDRYRQNFKKYGYSEMSMDMLQRPSSDPVSEEKFHHR